MEERDARQVQDIGAYVRGLEAALRSMPTDPSAGVSVRRLARSLTHAAESTGAEDLASRARGLQDASGADLERVTRDLLAYLGTALAPAPAPGLEVLVVEDNRTVAATIHAYLKRQARRVHVATSAQEAQELLATHAIDVVVLDLILPDRDGRELLIQLRQDPATASLPVIVLSAETGEVAKAECLAVGASEFIAKPPEPNALRAAVARHVAGRSRPAPAPAVDARPTLPSTRRSRVLLVEDDTVTSTLVRHRLLREGLEVAAFANGEDAFRWAESTGFELAILDVKVPGMDGFELLERLRRIPSLAGVPIVMLTGLAGEEDVVRGLELGANDYMVKPFSPTELLARVRRLVRMPGPEDSRLPSGAG